MPRDEIDGLTDSDCLTLLATVSIGRLLFTENALPAIRPVTFTTNDGQILIAVTEGSWANRLHGVLVAFAADHICPETRAGWGVLVHGTARLITDPRRALSVTIERVTGQHLVLT